MKFVLEGFSAICEELEETLVLIISDFRLGSDPQRFDKVDSLSVDGNGEIDEVRVLLHNLLNLSLFHKLCLILFQM